jgi:hypothetical protein
MTGKTLNAGENARGAFAPGIVRALARRFNHTQSSARHTPAERTACNNLGERIILCQS